MFEMSLDFLVIVILAAVIVAALVAVIARTIAFQPVKAGRVLERLKMPQNPNAIAEKMSAAIKVASLTPLPEYPERREKMLEMHAALEKLYPELHKVAERTVVGELSLIYKWKGKSSSLPVLFTAHLDVVPIAKDTEQDWTHPPFSGAIADGFVWGRGALDIKSHLVSVLEAADWLIKEGFVPKTDIWFAFGHDEEVGGKNGAGQIVKWFQENKIRFSWMQDEGGIVGDGLVKGVQRPLAMIGICEKGLANIRFTARDIGGHASMPPKHSALGVVATYLHLIEKYPMKLRLIPPVRMFFDLVGREMSFGMRVVFANLWLFKPLFLMVFSGKRTGNAMLRTTAAPTMAEASNAANVLPQKATAVANFRLLPGDDVNSLMAHLKNLANKAHVEIEAINLNNPSKVSAIDHVGFKSIADCVTRLYPGCLAVPYLMMAATDARWYEAVSDNQYRFTPYFVDEADLKRIHGTNERISIDNLNRCVAFFRNIMENTG